MIVFDIETSTKGEPNPQVDKLEYIGFYDLKNKECIIYDKNQKEEIKKVFKKHRIIISYNGNNYDIPILKREGLYNNNHISIDLYQVLKKRGEYIGLRNESLSLKNVAKKLNLAEQKQDDFDYQLLNKKDKTREEIGYIKKYLEQDLKTTTKLFEHIHNFFEPFKEYVNDYNKKTMKWLTCSIASFAYKAICNMCNIKEEYDDNTHSKTYEGGYVTEPIKAYASNVILFDFSSLYPFCFAQCNLFSPQNDGWTNKKIGMKGYYNPDNQGRIEQALMKLYKQRYEYKKKGDKREYTIKIIINSLYGAAANPVFKNLYNRTAARDCTAIARYCIKMARKIFTKAGYTCLYSDTDSIYVELNKKQIRETAEQVADYIINTIQKEFLFKEEMFKFKIDDEIKHIWFFKKNDKFLKKMYIYVTKQDKLVIKGLPLIKNDGSKIGYHIFNKYMKQSLIKGNNDFKYNDIKKWVYDELNNDISLVSREFKVKSFDWYKLPSQLQAQISKKYGFGRHLLICNDSYGVGIGKKYCTIKEFKEQGLGIHNIDLSKFWSEMKLFIDDYPVSVKVKRNKRRVNNQKLLEKWIN